MLMLYLYVYNIYIYIIHPIIQDRNIPIIARSKNESKLLPQSTFSKTYESQDWKQFTDLQNYELWTIHGQMPRVMLCFHIFIEKHTTFGGVQLVKILLVVSTNLKNVSQIGSFLQVGVNTKKWNHHQHLELFGSIMSLLRSCSPLTR